MNTLKNLDNSAYMSLRVAEDRIILFLQKKINVSSIQVLVARRHGSIFNTLEVRVRTFMRSQINMIHEHVRV